MLSFIVHNSPYGFHFSRSAHIFSDMKSPPFFENFQRIMRLIHVMIHVQSLGPRGQFIHQRNALRSFLTHTKKRKKTPGKSWVYSPPSDSRNSEVLPPGKGSGISCSFSLQTDPVGHTTQRDWWPEHCSGWWWLEPWNGLNDFPFSWEWNNPNWRVFHHFSEGFWYTTKQ